MAFPEPAHTPRAAFSPLLSSSGPVCELLCCLWEPCISILSSEPGGRRGEASGLPSHALSRAMCGQAYSPSLCLLSPTACLSALRTTPLRFIVSFSHRFYSLLPCLFDINILYGFLNCGFKKNSAMQLYFQELCCCSLNSTITPPLIRAEEAEVQRGSVTRRSSTHRA